MSSARAPLLGTQPSCAISQGYRLKSRGDYRYGYPGFDSGLLLNAGKGGLQQLPRANAVLPSDAV